MIVLMYQDVIDEAEADASGFQGPAANHYKLAPATFASHLAAGPSASANVLFTFDDGGCSALDPCADLLEQAGVRGLFFVPTDYIGHPGFCTGAHLRALLARGHAIGSHSASHPVPMSRLDDAALASEWERSKRVLEDVTGSHVQDASVPGGFTSGRVEQAAMRAGYARLFTSEPTRYVRSLGPMTIHGRYSVTLSTPVATIARVLEGGGAPWRSQAAWWNAKKMIKSLGGSAWLRLRQAYFARSRR
ncbi:MAG: polysaccharide deacetylase family protein [Gemmatimonadaceae bacterium]